MRRALITGGEGDIAQAIKKKLKGWEVDTPSSKELDVTSWYDVMEWFRTKDYDLVINNAGVIYSDNVEGSNVWDWIKTIKVNLIGTYLISRFALKNKDVTIINIASTAGVKGRAGWSSYCASKAGVISLTQSLKKEGVDAHCIILSRTNTKMRRKLFPDEDKSTLKTPQDVAKEIIKLL